MNLKLWTGALLLATAPCFGQGENNVWAFSNNAGLDFNSGSPVPFATHIFSYEGCASIADSLGRLLLYSNGSTIWNRNHVPMPNGNTIVTYPTISTAQASVIVKVPDSYPARYYVFSLEAENGLGRLSYSLVDMSLDGGLGDVAPGYKNILIGEGYFSEQMTAVAGTCNNVWLVAGYDSANTFKAFEITKDSIGLSPVVSVLSTTLRYKGIIKFSPDGRKMAASLLPTLTIPGYLQLYDFDAATGSIDHMVTLDTSIFNFHQYSGLCFSPDSKKLYADRSLFTNYSGEVFQYDLNAPTPAGVIASKMLVHTSYNYLLGDMKSGPDNKIYIAQLLEHALTCINNPNNAGTACNVNAYAVPLPAGTYCGLGLPNVVALANRAVPEEVPGLASNIATCDSERLSGRTGLTSFLWNTGAITRDIEVYAPGTYWVRSGKSCYGITDTFHVVPEVLKTDLGADRTVCNKTAINLAFQVDAPAGSHILWSTGNEQPHITIKDTGQYWVIVSKAFCTATDTISIGRAWCNCDLLIPSAFSPNGDGLNDLFFPIPEDPGCLQYGNYSLAIFNRWGQRVYWGDAKAKGWDGTYNGLLADIGTYMYELRYHFGVDPKEIIRKGDVILIR